MLGELRTSEGVDANLGGALSISFSPLSLCAVVL